MKTLPQRSALAIDRKALYRRVSSEDQADRGTIQAQRDYLRKRSELEGWDVACEYEDDGVSGTIPLSDRPAGRRLIDDAKQGLFSEVVVYRLDRLGRSLSALIDAHNLFQGIGVTIRSATEPFDTATPIGNFVFQLLGSMAELEKSTISERLTMGRDRTVRDGRLTGGAIPFGFDVDAERRLIPSPHTVEALGITEAQLVGRIYERIADGATILATCQWLNALGVLRTTRFATGRTVAATAEWRPPRITEMIHDPLYIGEGVFNSRAGALRRISPALVSRDLWERAQAQASRNRTLSKKNAKVLYLLRGLVRCKQCGRGFTGSTVASKTGRDIPYYRCNGQYTSVSASPEKRCKARRVPAEPLEALIWEDCRAFILNPGEALTAVQEQLRERLARSASHDEQRRKLHQRLAAKDAERERVMTLYRRGRASLEDTEAQLDAVITEKQDLQAQLDGLRAQEDLALAFEAQVVEATNLLTRFQARLDAIDRSNDWHGRREIVEALVAGITVQADGRKGSPIDTTIQYTFQAPQKVRLSSPSGRRTSHRSAGRLPAPTVGLAAGG